MDQKEFARLGGLARAKSLGKKGLSKANTKASKAAAKVRSEKAHQRKLAEAKALLAKEQSKH